MQIWLVGMMGTGKSSSGRLAADCLDVPFWDSDELVEDRLGMSISRIWETLGEGRFREVERSVIADIAASEGIAAAGGGAVVDGSNRARMAPARVVWLIGSPQTLARRLDGSPSRPLLAGQAAEEEIRRLIEERSEHYRSVATDQIDTDELRVEEVAARIVELWPR